VPSYLELDHVTAAATCIVDANRWTELKIELIKYVEDISNVDPDLLVYHGHHGTEEISIKKRLVTAVTAAALARGEKILCKVVEEFVPLEFELKSDGSEEEDLSIVASGMMSITLLVQRKTKI
jgi:hypothetical protein